MTMSRESRYDDGRGSSVASAGELDFKGDFADDDDKEHRDEEEKRGN
jgi:hypothetical protein